MAHVARPAGGKAAQSADEEDGDDDASSEGSRRGGLLGYLLGLLSRGSEEFVPWISWKVYDVLFALLLLHFAKRVKFIQRLRDMEVL